MFVSYSDVSRTYSIYLSLRRPYGRRSASNAREYGSLGTCLDKRRPDIQVNSRGHCNSSLASRFRRGFRIDMGDHLHHTFGPFPGLRLAVINRAMGEMRR